MEQALEYKDITVGIAGYHVDRSPNRIVTLGLGSCVGICVYDQQTRIGGLLHIMLPDSSQFGEVKKPGKFADTGVPALVEEVAREGGRLSRLFAKLAGGAQMFSGNGDSSALNIGTRNVAAVRQALGRMGIRIAAEDVGGSQGRTIFFDLNTGQVIIRTMGNNYRVI
ncbi:MAG: chemotaxis protein CheD [Peptococcaceae bacterium]|jgi:chemotaxis protein CheD|nr:chemotaxis protein CheD [Peptococcaceae bacterium]